MVAGWMKNNLYGSWCLSNKTCMQVVNNVLLTATTAETAAIAHWLHPTTLMELNWINTFETDARKAYAWASGVEQKVVALVSKLGAYCGSNSTCQKLASEAVNEGLEIDGKAISSIL